MGHDPRQNDTVQIAASVYHVGRTEPSRHILEHEIKYRLRKIQYIVIEHARRVARKQFENRDPAQIAVGNLFCSVLEFGPVPTSPTPSNCFERKLSINNLCFLLFFLCIRLFRGVFLFAFRSRWTSLPFPLLRLSAFHRTARLRHVAATCVGASLSRAGPCGPVV